MQRHGKIEKFEIFPEKYPFCEEVSQYYAFVTYADSASANRAISTKSTEFCLGLADTWKQPDAKTAADYVAQDEEILLNRLPEHCLIEIFNYIQIDSLVSVTKVCDRFNAIVRNHVYPLKRKVALNLSEGDLGLVWYTILNVLRYAKFVLLEKIPCCGVRNMERLTDVFSKNLNANLVRLDLLGVLITDRLFEQLKPALKNLKILKWNRIHPEDVALERDFVSWCPALEQLNISTPMNFDDNSAKWTSLRSATLLCYFDKLFPQFCANNTQLTRLKICIFDRFAMVREICDNLANLVNLKIYFHGFSSASHFRDLFKLKQLKALRLVAHQSGDGDYSLLLNEIGKLPLLKKLEIDFSCHIDRHFDLEALASKLVHLEWFHISVFGLTKPKLLSFIKLAPKLTALIMDTRDLALSDKLIEKIAKIRKEQAERAKSTPPILNIYARTFQTTSFGIQGIVSVCCIRPDMNFAAPW